MYELIDRILEQANSIFSMRDETGFWIKTGLHKESNGDLYSWFIKRDELHWRKVNKTESGNMSANMWIKVIYTQDKTNNQMWKGEYH
jgi:hypothetical protein